MKVQILKTDLFLKATSVEMRVGVRRENFRVPETKRAAPLKALLLHLVLRNENPPSANIRVLMKYLGSEGGEELL